jgi:hypothetical protein
MGWVNIARSGVAQYPWRNAGTLSTAQAALTTDKSAATVNALTSTGTVFVSPTDNTVALDLRFRGGADGDSNVISIYAMAGTDHYTKIIDLTLTTGTQTDGTNLFVDTLAGANELWADDIVVLSDAANGIAHVELNTHGYSSFLFIATTLNSSSVLVDWRRV